ncbi:hypothetical protein XYCOK13_03210 [Xylanibacillus composti]|uniref:Uncharacterized protein n=2 Tax=Xylanibacillus composti TaxID=1572762 RepID=A0A8J4H141_9BACL|nr:hypothetical protein XYCOK13_03210 [Xylanibacillus composti]
MLSLVTMLDIADYAAAKERRSHDSGRTAKQEYDAMELETRHAKNASWKDGPRQVVQRQRFPRHGIGMLFIMARLQPLPGMHTCWVSVPIEGTWKTPNLTVHSTSWCKRDWKGWLVCRQVMKQQAL